MNVVAVNVVSQRLRYVFVIVGDDNHADLLAGLFAELLTDWLTDWLTD